MSDLARAVLQCRSNRPLMAELRELYEQVDAAVAASGALCMGGGACCRFDVAGHRLYVTTAELALLSTLAPPRPSRAPGG